jgi:glycosyltransferase involved in cell wall biosynthesis
VAAASARKHIVLVGPAYPYRGGIAHFTETVYHGMQGRGHDVSAVTFSRQYPELLFPGKTQYVEESSENPVDTVRIIDTLNPWTWWWAARRIARAEPDVVVFSYWMSYFAPAFGTIARYLRYRGITVLCIVHNALPHERRTGDVWLGRFFLRACDGLVVLSETVEEDLQRLQVNTPVEQVDHPVYDIFGDSIPRSKARARLGLPDTAPVLLFFGFIRKYKGLHVLLEAMLEIVRQHPQTRLLVAGEFYEDEAFYRELVKEYELEDSVVIHGRYIPEEEVSTYFAAADLVVQPYISATQSGVAQIAYHFERPLVITDVGGLPDVVPHEKAGFVVPPENAEALAAAVDRFFADDWAERLEEGVRAEKGKYSWDRLYGALEQLMKRSNNDSGS